MSSGRPVGIFDSGIGGLTVAAAVRRQLPHESLVYLGDTARVPYGPKSPTTVRRYAREILDWLLSQSVKAVVVACNTVTAHAIDELREAAGEVPVIGVIEPGADAAAAVTRNGVIGVIGTVGTIASGAYQRALLARNADLQVIAQACPLFVPFVEEGWFDHPAARLVAQEYLAPLRTAGVDTLVLGCTHYPLLKPLLGSIMGEQVRLIDSAEETAGVLALVLDTNDLAAPANAKGSVRWTATDDVARFRHVSELFLGYPPGQVDLVDLSAERLIS